jgi:micrococcal nuclease
VVPVTSRWLAVLLAIAVAAAIVGGCAATPTVPTPTAYPTGATASPDTTPPGAEASSAPPTRSRKSVPKREPATVIRVVDGDTIHARLNGKDEKVRIIGMDSPEIDKPDTPVECFARQASAAAKRLLKPSDPIVLQPDPTQDTRDRYGRLLAHVFLADGSLFAETMIRHGWAVHYVYDGVPSIYAERLAAAEAKARADTAGLWSPKTCNGNPHEATKPT